MALFALALPSRAQYVNTFEVDNIRYGQIWSEDPSTSSELSAIGYSGEDPNLEIPQFVTYQGKRYIVTCIGSSWDEGGITFYNNQIIENVTLPNSVTAIYDNAFYGCSNLKSIDIPSSVSYIGSYVFFGCKSLISIELPDNLTTISDGMFSNCVSLQAIKIPNGVTTIGVSAFGGCVSMVNVEIPEGVQSINSFAFSACFLIENIKIPESVETIGSSVFNECHALKTVVLPHNLKKLENEVFARCHSLQDLFLPDTLEEIGDSTFSQCYSLFNVEVPKSVKVIGKEAFVDCYKINNVKLPSSLTKIKWGAFLSCESLKSIVIPDSVKIIEAEAFSGCNLEKLVIKSQDVSIDEHSFACSNLNTIYSISSKAPKCAYNTFNNYAAQIFVPLGSVEDYLQATGWNKFTNYRERGVRFDKESLAMQLDESYQLTPLFVGGNEGETFSYEWATDNADVVTVDENGVMKAVGLGAATVTATTTDSNDITYTATCRVEVKTDFDLSHAAITMNSDESFQLGIISDDAESVYTWTSNDPTVAYVNESGLVNAMGVEGECVISAVKDGIAVNCNVSVTDFNVGSFPVGVNYTIGKKNTITITESPEAEGDIYIPDYVRIDGEMYCVTKIGDNAFANAGDRITSVYIPNSVEEIGKEAFRDCTALTYVHLGSELVSIGERAFSYAKIDVLECEAVIPPYLFKDCFLGAEVKLLRVPTSALVAYLTTNYEGAYGWSGLGNDIEGSNFEANRVATRAEEDSVKLDPTAIVFESVSIDPCMMNVRLQPVGACTVIEWASSNIEVATIDRGLITFIGEQGTSVFTAVTSNGLIAKSPEVSGVEEIFTENVVAVNIYNLQGVCLKRNATKADVESLASGLYIIGGKKVLVK